VKLEGTLSNILAKLDIQLYVPNTEDEKVDMYVKLKTLQA